MHFKLKTPNFDFALLNFSVVAPTEPLVKLWQVELHLFKFELLYNQGWFFLTGSLKILTSSVVTRLQSIWQSESLVEWFELES